MAFRCVAAARNGGERRPRPRPPTPATLGFAGSSPSTQTATRFANGRSRNWPPRGSERVSSSARKAGSSASKPISGLWKSSQRVGLDRAGLGVHAGDRQRVDLVAEVGQRARAARDQRVGERLQRRVGEVDRGLRRRDGARMPLGDRQRRQHEPAEAERASRAAGPVAAGQQPGDRPRVPALVAADAEPTAILPRLSSRLRRLESTRPGYYPNRGLLNIAFSTSTTTRRTEGEGSVHRSLAVTRDRPDRLAARCTRRLGGADRAVRRRATRSGARRRTPAPASTSPTRAPTRSASSTTRRSRT